MKLSKLVNSRDEWKRKAKCRGSAIRDLRKVSNAHKKRQARDERTIRRLEDEVAELRIALNARGCPVESVAVMDHKTLCVLIVVCGIVSFRSVPRILQVFQPLLWAKIPIPHFTSVIHWTLRVGIAIFNQAPAIAEPMCFQLLHQWAAIIDCSIEIGTRKALVVLRVPGNLSLSPVIKKRSFLDFGRPDRHHLRRGIAGNGLIQGVDCPQMAHLVRGLRKGPPPW